MRAMVRARRADGHVPDPDYPARVLAAVPRGVVCCYVSLPGEPPTPDLIEALLVRGDQVYLPIAGARRTLHWTPATSSRPWRAWGLGPGPTPEPVPLPEPATVIVPALAVDATGQRLGQGGGYYDRFLPTVPQARTVALIWHDEVFQRVPAQRHDIRVDTWVIADG